MAKIYWDKTNYAMVEKIFRQSAEFCSEHEIWKLNVAHMFFMQETKYKEAIRYYEPIVKKAMTTGILEVTAIVLANLCVSYIMTSQNEDAEELMRAIEREEERVRAFVASVCASTPPLLSPAVLSCAELRTHGGGPLVAFCACLFACCLVQVAVEDPDKPTFHLCIVNLVIGTLYCAKGNYEFGISRIMKSLEPYDKKLGTDTWYYAKRCFLGLANTMAKHMVTLKDTTMYEILNFFDAADQHGKKIVTVVKPDNEDKSNCNVAHEARVLKRMYLLLKDNKTNP